MGVQRDCGTDKPRVESRQLRSRWRRSTTALGFTMLALTARASAASAEPAFEISFPASAHPEPITGRVFVMISRKNQPEVRLQSSWLNSPQFFAVAADQWKPGQRIAIDTATLGYPFRSLSKVPAGDYYVQAFVNVYVRYPRADGHVIWAQDQWNGQEFAASPGNLYSPVQKVHFDPAQVPKLTFNLTEVVPPAVAPADTDWVKHVKIQSKLLTRFWGHPIYLGAVVVLPRDYTASSGARYPVIYYQKHHVMRDGPFSFSTTDTPETEGAREERENGGYETGYEFYRAWQSEHFPRMIAATFVNPTPFYDFSGAQNSANNGPYADAIKTELIPYLEEHFRIIREPYARVLIGKSSGARDAFALQLHYPDFFGGAWMFYPWVFDYAHYNVLDIYKNDSAFYVDPKEASGFRDPDNEWNRVERFFPRTLDGRPMYSMREYALHDAVQGGESGVSAELTGSDDALNGPLGKNGYPVPLYDKLTGKIDHDVASYWHEHGDLYEYTKAHWASIGPSLVGKLHFYVGESDEWYRSAAVHHLEDFLKSTTTPYYTGSFTYGPGKGHGWQPMTNAELVKTAAAYVAAHAPKGADVTWNAH